MSEIKEQNVKYEEQPNEICKKCNNKFLKKRKESVTFEREQ